MMDLLFLAAAYAYICVGCAAIFLADKAGMPVTHPIVKIGVIFWPAAPLMYLMFYMFAPNEPQKRSE